MLVGAELQRRMLLYGEFMRYQRMVLEQLPGFREITIPDSLASKLSSKLVPAAPVSWSPPPPVSFPPAQELHNGDSKRGDPLFSRENSRIGDILSLSSLQTVEFPPSPLQQHFELTVDKRLGQDSAIRGEVLANPCDSNGENTRIEADDRDADQAQPREARQGKLHPLVHSRLFCSSRLRRARFTYFDGGAAVQAFNSLCYPHPWLDVPLLGVDLLSFGGSKLLCVIDMQPVTDTHHRNAQVLSRLDEFRKRHKDMLFQPMTSRFFDETRFFSPHMLLFRSSQGWHDPVVQAPHGQLFSALRLFLQQYNELLNSAPALHSARDVERVQQGQRDYEAYFAANDPAIPLFSTYFGQEWSDRYTEEFLFPEAGLQCQR